mgnify:CR=1 FL=1
MAVHVGQAEVAAGVAVGEPFVVEAQQMQNRRVQVVDVQTGQITKSRDVRIQDGRIAEIVVSGPREPVEGATYLLAEFEDLFVEEYPRVARTVFFVVQDQGRAEERAGLARSAVGRAASSIVSIAASPPARTPPPIRPSCSGRSSRAAS